MERRRKCISENVCITFIITRSYLLYVENRKRDIKWKAESRRPRKRERERETACISESFPLVKLSNLVRVMTRESRQSSPFPLWSSSCSYSSNWIKIRRKSTVDRKQKNGENWKQNILKLHMSICHQIRLFFISIYMIFLILRPPFCLSFVSKIIPKLIQHYLKHNNYLIYEYFKTIIRRLNYAWLLHCLPVCVACNRR